MTLKNPKAKGAYLERRAKKILEQAGYDVVKSSASLGIFDLIAWNRQGFRFIQVKANYCREEEKEKIALYGKIPPNVSRELWIFRDRQREPVIKIF